MIEIKNVSKHFGSIFALENVSVTMNDGEIFGLVGTNGSGKSTLLRLLSGVLKADQGQILIDGQEVWEDPEVKKNICFLSDTGYYFPNATPEMMAENYAIAYPGFDKKRFFAYLKKLELDPKRKVRTFSKGMKKQLLILLGICTGAQYLFCDETFDGLDPVMRQTIKSVFAAEMLDRDFTPVVASHNLRELEDFCDHVGLLHKCGILLSENLEDLKFHTQTIQSVLRHPEKQQALLEELQVVSVKRSGSLLTFVAKGTSPEILQAVNARLPDFAESLPLTLEEIFIYETEVAGYDIRNILA